MSFIEAQNYGPVSNAVIYGLHESIARAKYSMSTDANIENIYLTKGIEKIAQGAPGTGHDQWLTGVVAQFDLTFSNKAWVEAERYHFLDFVSSQSTMHKITQFDLNKAYNKYVDNGIIAIMKRKVDEYNKLAEEFKNSNVVDDSLRNRINDLYLEILYSNPAGFMLTAGMTTNYRQLKTIYLQRKTHRLPEWREFCHWIELLPYGYLITNKI